MQELRFVAVSEDGSYAVLAIPGRSGRFMLPIDDRLRAVARGQFSRLAQYEIEVENPLRPKEIQARIRAGETVEEIADAAGIPVERVRWFEGPVLAERGYVAQQAQTASVRRQGDSTPGPRLGEVVAERLTELGADPEDAQWDSRKHGDGSWQVQLAFRAGGRLHIAEWLFDPRRRHVLPADDNASRLSLPEAELPPPTGGSLGAATVTPIRPRPDRSQPAPPPEPVMEPAEEPARAAAHAAAPGSFAPSRAPIGRPPSHAAPQPGSPRMPVSDDEPNGTGRGPAHRAGGTGRPAPGQGADDRNAGRTPAATPASPAAQGRAAPGPAAQPPLAAAQAPPERIAGPPGTGGSRAAGPASSGHRHRARHPRHLPSARHARNAPPRGRPLRKLPRVRPLRNRPARRPPMLRPRGRPRQASRPARAPAVRITTARRPRLSHRPTSPRTKPRPAGGARRPRARAAGVPPSPPGTRSCSVIRASPSNGGTRAVRRPSAVTARIRSGTGSRPASPGGEFPVATEGQG